MMEGEYENFRRLSYDGAIFVPVCSKCGRFVKADKEIHIYEVAPCVRGPNAMCKRCGRVEMLFEGFY